MRAAGSSPNLEILTVVEVPEIVPEGPELGDDLGHGPVEIRSLGEARRKFGFETRDAGRVVRRLERVCTEILAVEQVCLLRSDALRRGEVVLHVDDELDQRRHDATRFVGRENDFARPAGRTQMNATIEPSRNDEFSCACCEPVLPRLAPGPHRVSVSKAGYVTVENQVNVAEGIVTHVQLRLVPLEPPGSGQPLFTTLERSNPSAQRASAESPSGGTRTVVIVVGAGLTALALGTGAYFAIDRASNLNRADELRGQLKPYERPGAPNSACAEPSTAPPSWCSELHERNDTVNRDTVGRDIALVSGAVLGAATVATLLLWPRSGGSSSAAFLIAPQIGRDNARLILMGSY